MHPSTKEGIKRFISSTPHGIGLSGSSESGKKYLSKYLISKILGIKDVQDYPYVMFIDCGKGTGIDEVREAIKFLSLKIPSDKKYKRGLVFWSFESLGSAAQNALLKSLEEPPEDTLVIITTDAKIKLLPTIVSRLSWIEVKPVSYEITLNHLSDRYSEKAIEKAYSLSAGKIGMTFKLAEDYQAHPMAEYIETVKSILRMEKYERLAEIDKLNKDKEFDVSLFLKSLVKVLEAAMKSKLTKTGKTDRKLLDSLKRISRAQNSLVYNTNQKLILTEIFYRL